MTDQRDRTKRAYEAAARITHARIEQEAPLVLFPHGNGEVFHMISHYYLQRTELRDKRHHATGAEYAMSKGVAVAEDLAGLSAGDVESAASSNRWMANVVVHHKRRVKKQ